MELIQNRFPSTAYSPQGQIEVVADDNFPVFLTDKHHRLVMIAPGKYQIISGSFTGKVVSFVSFDKCKAALKPEVVWMPVDLVEFTDFRGEEAVFGLHDRLVAIDENVLVFSAGPLIGRKVSADTVFDNLVLAPEA